MSDEKLQVVDGVADLQLLAVRLKGPIVEQLRRLADLEGIDSEGLAIQVLTEYVEENQHRLEESLMPHLAAAKAESLLAEALKYKEKIPRLKKATDERLRAESDYSTTLSNANALFSQAYENCSDRVLKRHLELRLNQIGDLLDKGLQAFNR